MVFILAYFFGLWAFLEFPGTWTVMKDEGLALLSFCGLEPRERQITAFSRPGEHM